MDRRPGDAETLSQQGRELIHRGGAPGPQVERARHRIERREGAGDDVVDMDEIPLLFAIAKITRSLPFRSW